MDFSKCWQDCAKEALKRIDRYRERKEENVFDDFYNSHLDLMQELLEELYQADEKYVALIVAKKRNQYEDGNSTPRYVTICKKPHWTHEGIMTASGTHDTTKFKPSSEDLQEILGSYNDGRKEPSLFTKIVGCTVVGITVIFLVSLLIFCLYRVVEYPKDCSTLKILTTN